MIIITRPGDTGCAMADALNAAGRQAIWWPAFELDLTPDAAAQTAFARLADFDCVVFVSVSAVAAVARLMDGGVWPDTVAIAAVGAATASAARAMLPVSDAVRLISPNDDDRGDADGAAGSEALWPELAAVAPRRVLIARAQHGREWLADKLRASGSDVNSVAVYSRRAVPLSPAQRVQLLRWRDEGVRPVTVFTSSEAVDVVLGHDVDEAGAVLRAGVSVATHPRIAARLGRAGAQTIVPLAAPTADALIEKLRSLEFHTP